MPSLPIHNPLGPPTISGTSVTVDVMLQQPTRITSMVSDLTLQKFILDRVFDNGGGVSGGAVIFDVTSQNEIYASADVEQVAPGAEFPTVTAERLAPSTASVEKWGGKFDITDEAKDRNDTSILTRGIRVLGNTLVRKNNQRAVAVLEAANISGRNVAPGSTVSWSDSIALAPNTAGYTPAAAPHFTLATAVKNAEIEELGTEYDLLLVNPQEAANLRLYYNFNGQNGLPTVLSDYGITEMFVSNRITAGTAYLVQKGNVGQYRVEAPLNTITNRDEMLQKTWVLTSARWVPFVQNPFGFVKLTGLAA